MSAEVTRTRTWRGSLDAIKDWLSKEAVVGAVNLGRRLLTHLEIEAPGRTLDVKHDHQERKRTQVLDNKKSSERYRYLVKSTHEQAGHGEVVRLTFHDYAGPEKGTEPHTPMMKLVQQPPRKDGRRTIKVTFNPEGRSSELPFVQAEPYEIKTFLTANRLARVLRVLRTDRHNLHTLHTEDGKYVLREDGKLDVGALEQIYQEMRDIGRRASSEFADGQRQIEEARAGVSTALEAMRTRLASPRQPPASRR